MTQGPQREQRGQSPSRTPAMPAVPQNGSGGGSPAGGGAPPSGATTSPTLGKPEIETAINRKIGGDYGPGAGYLADKWLAETSGPMDAVAVDAKASASGDLYLAMVAAWRAAKASDEAFVKDFGQPDTIALQKFADLDAERIIEGSITRAKQQFYAAVKAKIAGQRTARSAVYPLMADVARSGGFTKRGMRIAQAKIGEMARRAHGIDAFYDYNLTNAKRAETEQEALQELAVAAGYTGAGLGVFRDAHPHALTSTPGKALVRQKFRKKAAAAGDVKGWGQDNSPVGNPANPGWFSPDEIQVSPADNDGYEELMTMFALQPEWYPEGALGLDIDTSGIHNARKPTAFDGMMSPLWVQRPQDAQTFGVTGGGAREYVADAPKWHKVRAARPHSITDTYHAQLQTLAQTYKSRDVSGETGVPGATVGTTPTEAVIRGNAPARGGSRPQRLGQNIVGTSRNEANNPSQVPGNAPTNGAPTPTPAGGTFGPSRTARAGAPSSTPGGPGGGGSGGSTTGRSGR